MKRILSMLLCAAVLAVIVSCSKDDDNKEGEIATGTRSYVGTISIRQADQTVFNDENLTVDLTFNETAKTVDMKVNKVKFAANMPMRLDMTVKDIKYTERDGEVVFSGAEFIPEAMGGPQVKYKITNLSGKVVPQSMAFTMICLGLPVSFTGSAVK